MNVRPMSVPVLSGLAALGVLVILIVYAKAIMSAFGRPASVADAGDMFGGASALFSGLAFAGVIGALVLQARALRVQRDDLRATQEELRAATAVHQEHLDHLERSERRRLTLQLAERLSSDRMVFARSAVREWRSIQVKRIQRPNATVQEPSNAPEIASGVRSFVDFLSDCDAMAAAGLVDRRLAFGLFGRELIDLAYEIEFAPNAEILALWPDWSSLVHPRVERLRAFLQKDAD